MTVGCVVLGSSFSKFSAEELTKITRDTPYGTGVIYAYQGTSSFVQFRHGLPHTLLPTQINWRAQAWMWKEFGVQSLLLTSSVGVLDVGVPLYQPLLCADLLMPFNQLPDGSVCTMFTLPSAQHGHLLLQDGLFHSQLRSILSQRWSEGQSIPEVVFGYVPGPRTKTKTENRFWRLAGAQVNSMSIGPEVVLANELEIPTAALFIGHKYSLEKPVDIHTHDSIEDSLIRAKKESLRCIQDFLLHPPCVQFSNHLYRF